MLPGDKILVAGFGWLGTLATSWGLGDNVLLGASRGLSARGAEASPYISLMELGT